MKQQEAIAASKPKSKVTDYIKNNFVEHKILKESYGEIKKELKIGKKKTFAPARTFKEQGTKQGSVHRGSSKLSNSSLARTNALARNKQSDTKLPLGEFSSPGKI